MFLHLIFTTNSDSAASLETASLEVRRCPPLFCASWHASAPARSNSHKEMRTMLLRKCTCVFARQSLGPLAFASWLLGCLILAAAPASAQSTCAQQGTISINSNQYIYQQDEWNSTATQCATVSGVGFSLTTANFNLPNGGPPATYPSIFMGCHWGNCTNASQSHLPIQESNIASASTSVNTTLTSSGNYDVAYDIWFNQTSTTSGQPNGTEVMVWINHSGFPQPFGSKVATVSIDGASWDVWTGRQSSWNIVSYVRT